MRFRIFTEPQQGAGYGTLRRVAAMLLLTLRGTPTLYQGDELGLTDVKIPPDRVRRPTKYRPVPW